MKESNTKSNVKNTEGKSRTAPPPAPIKYPLGLTKLKADDFRINNLCQDQNGNLLRVSVLMDNGNIQFTVVDRSKFPLPDGWKAEPIPLSESWLIGFGFKVSEDTYFEIKIQDKPEVMLSIEPESKNCAIGSYVDWSNPLKIEYVHEIQNLYHSLTGKELEPMSWT